MANLQHVVFSEQFQDALKTSKVQPLILAGDFNVGSHEDWDENVRFLLKAPS